MHPTTIFSLAALALSITAAPIQVPGDAPTSCTTAIMHKNSNSRRSLKPNDDASSSSPGRRASVYNNDPPPKRYGNWPRDVDEHQAMELAGPLHPQIDRLPHLEDDLVHTSTIEGRASLTMPSSAPNRHVSDPRAVRQNDELAYDPSINPINGRDIALDPERQEQELAVEFAVGPNAVERRANRFRDYNPGDRPNTYVTGRETYDDFPNHQRRGGRSFGDKFVENGIYVGGAKAHWRRTDGVPSPEN